MIDSQSAATGKAGEWPTALNAATDRLRTVSRPPAGPSADRRRDRQQTAGGTGGTEGESGGPARPCAVKGMKGRCVTELVRHVTSRRMEPVWHRFCAQGRQPVGYTFLPIRNTAHTAGRYGEGKTKTEKRTKTSRHISKHSDYNACDAMYAMRF